MNEQIDPFYSFLLTLGDQPITKVIDLIYGKHKDIQNRSNKEHGGR